MSGLRLHLAPEYAAQVLDAARARFPEECCGLIEGMRGQEGWTVTAVHETANIAPDRKRHFLIDPQAQIRVLRRLRGTGFDVIGCFHSHPNGHPEPSPTDHEMAVDEDFIWLLAGGGPQEFTLAAWVYAPGGFVPVELTPAP